MAVSQTRWSRAFVAAGIVWFVCWQLLVVAGAGRRGIVTAGIYGFVMHIVFGKGYALIPSYFERTLAVGWAPAVHFPMAVLGTVILVLDGLGVNTGLRPVGVVLWALGVGMFIGALLWTVRDNLIGIETGTAAAKADRAGVDRLANAFVPVVLFYLAASAVLPLLALFVLTAIPSVAARTHLLAAGTAALLIFAIGFRLLPRFLVVKPTRIGPVIVLPAGALAPALLVTDFQGGALFQVGAVLQAIALLGFAGVFLRMYWLSDRRRVGFPVVGLGTLAGAGAVLVGLYLALIGLDASLIAVHVRLASLGFLGLIVMGVSYQFYPPNIGSYPGVSDRSALAAAVCIVLGLLVEIAGTITLGSLLVRAGEGLVLVGALAYSYIVLSIFAERAT